MKNPAILGLAPMLDALRIKQTVSHDECLALFKELREKTDASVPSFELSGNQWCALVNLAVARYGAGNVLEVAT